jgi:serine/threonine protein kinase
MHKCFSKIYDSFIDTNTLYLLLDSFDLNLNDYKNSHKITKVQWKKIKAELITAITALHSLQLCHNNICPENIMYSYKQDRFYFIDFKMAKQSTEEDKLRDLKQISILDKNVL